jgi:hypothetical protein
MEDRRKRQRFDLSQLSVSWKPASDKDDPGVPYKVGGAITDFSFQGLGMVTQEPLNEGDVVYLRVKYGDRQNFATGRVARRKRLPGRDTEIGIELDEADKGFVLNLIARYFKGREQKKTYALVVASVLAGIVGFLVGVLVS